MRLPGRISSDSLKQTTAFGADVGACGSTRRTRENLSRRNAKRKDALFMTVKRTQLSYTMAKTVSVGVNSVHRQNYPVSIMNAHILPLIQNYLTGGSLVSFLGKVIAAKALHRLH